MIGEKLTAAAAWRVLGGANKGNSIKTYGNPA